MTEIDPNAPRYAIVDSDGVIQNIVIWDGESEFPLLEGMTLQLLEEGVASHPGVEVGEDQKPHFNLGAAKVIAASGQLDYEINVYFGAGPATLTLPPAETNGDRCGLWNMTPFTLIVEASDGEIVNGAPAVTIPAKSASNALVFGDGVWALVHSGLATPYVP